MKTRLLSAAVAALFVAAAPAQAETPRVVASIAPIHSLVAAVMDGVGEPELLISAEVSSHDYALKPSDLRKIVRADLVIWIGGSLESYLVKPLETEGVAQLELIEADGMDPHLYAEEHSHAEHAAEDEEDERGYLGVHEHDHLGHDPHVWLDPVRAETMVRVVAHRLSEMDPANAALYQANAELAIAHLEALDGEIRTRLAPYSSKPFITFHDGYAYFVERYGLNQVGQLTVHPEQRPGAASLSELRATIAGEGVACLFGEPQFDPDVLRSLAGDAAAKVAVLDPLGAGLEPGSLLYEALLRKNTEAIASCLSSTS